LDELRGKNQSLEFEQELSMESINIINIYPRPYCKLSNAPEKLGYKLHLEDIAEVLICP
jgi:hypothetical protein